MGSHPLNLAFRFILELSSLASAGIWGWRQGEGWLKFGLAIGCPIIIAAIWGTFVVPDDPSRSGKAPVVIPGLVRLALELVIFALATWALYDMGYGKIGLTLGIATMIHYIFSYDRIRWLISH